MQAVYDGLTQRGMNRAQATGVMGNIAHEDSTFGPETAAMDTNGYMSYGLVQWNAASHPDASKFVTGRPKADLSNQLDAIVAAFKTEGITGDTPQAVAGEWAANFERCVGCQPGQQQWTERRSSAAQIFGYASSGHWPKGGAGLTSTGSSNGASFGNVKWYEPWTWGNAAGDATSSIEHFGLHYGTIALAVIAGGALAVVGLIRATTGQKPTALYEEANEKGEQAAAIAATAAA